MCYLIPFPDQPFEARTIIIHISQRRKVKLSTVKFPCVLISQSRSRGILSDYLEMCSLENSVLLMPKIKYIRSGWKWPESRLHVCCVHCSLLGAGQGA